MNKRLFIKMQCAFGAGSPIPARLLRAFGSVEGIFSATAAELGKAVRSPKISVLLDGDFSETDEIINVCRENGIQILTYNDREFPDRLRNIADPPMALYVKGKLPRLDDEMAIAVVGPRKADEYGVKAAFSLSGRLALAGAIIISGGALGIDSEAHKGALWADMPTVAVLGCGLLFPYLDSNKELRERIAQNGAVISEFPPYHPAGRSTFPVRNRIMSGLSLGVAVIQAGKKSGALITARLAAEQGRDVFVVPGKPGDSLYEGSNLLLKDGAKPLLSAADIIEEYALIFPHKLDLTRAYSGDGQNIAKGFKEWHSVSENKGEDNKTPDTEIITEYDSSQFDENTKVVWENLLKGVDSPDLIAEQTELGSADIIAALTELEICGYVVASAGGRYIICKN